ncbi:MAG: ABC-2 family transporter protein [Bryobacteraceae bacterium]|nr:ABC-2 family transporter protein [Bryobacteraceae bacterium]
MRRHVSLLAQYFIQYSKVRLAYRGDFIISVVTTIGATLFGIAVVWLIFKGAPRVAGWTFYEIVFLYGFSLLPMSVFNMLSINLYYFSEIYIVEGKFDRVLLRPVNSLFQILFEQFRLEALGDTVLGLFLIVTCARRIGLELGAGDWLFIAAATVCGCLIYLAIFLLLTCISFWMEDRVGVIPPVYNMLTFGRYPMDIYNPFIKFLLSWVVPFGFATYYPTAAVLKQDEFRIYAWLMPVVTVVFGALSLFVWKRGVRNYSSTGS